MFSLVLGFLDVGQYDESVENDKEYERHEVDEEDIDTADRVFVVFEADSAVDTEKDGRSGTGGRGHLTGLELGGAIMRR